MTDEPKQPEGNENRTGEWTALAGIAGQLERQGVWDMIESGTKLTCDTCHRITYTGRQAKAGERCYKQCNGTLRAKGGE